MSNDGRSGGSAALTTGLRMQGHEPPIPPAPNPANQSRRVAPIVSSNDPELDTAASRQIDRVINDIWEREGLRGDALQEAYHEYVSKENDRGIEPH